MSGKMTVITVAALIHVSTPEIFPSGGATSDGVLVHSSTELGPGLVPVVAKVRPTLSSRPSQLSSSRFLNTQLGEHGAQS